MLVCGFKTKTRTTLSNKGDKVELKEFVDTLEKYDDTPPSPPPDTKPDDNEPEDIDEEPDIRQEEGHRYGEGK